jgi:hypothetical protein
MNKIEQKIKKIIDSTEYNHLIWIYDADTGISKTTVGDCYLELIDNTDCCERCCCDLEDCGCEDPINGTVILTGYSGIYQFDYNDVSSDLLDKLAEVVMDCRITPKEDLTIGETLTRETILDLFI